jgi:D-glycero-alpha-D-manno-heptose-7-phosphate kinase
MTAQMKKIKKEGSVRVDLLGGTLDIHPINLVLEHAITLNVATQLKAVVELEETDREGVEIHSIDYDSVNFFKTEDFTEANFRNGFFGPLSFVCQIIYMQEAHRNLKVTLESGSPPGAGLGGSSSMGGVLYGALAEYQGKQWTRQEAISRVQNIESRILDSGPAGYQDYYPALYGGVLALIPGLKGVEVEQLYTAELKELLESHMTLVFSGEHRQSGVTNWEVYKGFFDKNEVARGGLTSIADLSHKAYLAIKDKSYDDLLSFIAQEGQYRKELFETILTPNMKDLYETCKKEVPGLGVKVCGAGGGGCFLLLHRPEEREIVEKAVIAKNMKVLPFKIDAPL